MLYTAYNITYICVETSKLFTWKKYVNWTLEEIDAYFFRLENIRSLLMQLMCTFSK